MNDSRFFEARVRDIATEATTSKAPADAWQRIAARVGSGDVVVLPVDASVQPEKRIGAASIVIVLLAAAAAAATIPEWPIREWLSRRPATTTITREAPATEVTAPPEPVLSTTLIVTPVAGLATVSFVNSGPRARVRVRFTDQPDVAVRASGAATNAIFASGEGNLTIGQLDGGDLEIAIPRSLARVRVEVDGRLYLTKQGEQIRVLAPVADTVGSEFILPIGKY